MIRSSLLGLLLVLAPSLGHGEIVVRVALETTVDGPGITLGEVASITGASESERARLAALPLGDAAAPARARVLPRASLERALARSGIETALEAHGETRVVTRHREIGPDWLQPRLERALAQRMPWEPEQVTLEKWRLPQPFPVSADATRLSVRFRPDEDFVGKVAISIELSEPGRDPTRRAAAVYARVEAPVAVTTRKLRRGHVLRRNDLRLEDRLLDLLPSGVVRDADRVTGEPLAQSIEAGVALSRRQLATRPVVRRGDPIAVLAESDGLTLRMQAKALEAGSVGEMIRVENPVSRRRFRAQVTGPGSARLMLAGVGSAR